MKAKTCQLVAGIAACLMIQASYASDSPAAKSEAAELDAALKAVPAGAPVPAVVVKKGDSLDKLIARYVKNSPFSQDVVRKAVMQKNPNAFKDGKAQGIVVGAQLQWPTMADYRKVLMSAGLGVDGGQRAEEPAPVVPTDPRKGWVRFP